MHDAVVKVPETDDAHVRLREAILRVAFMPNEHLGECDLARQFSVGRAAIRAALARLEQEGIVKRSPFRGARVRLVSETEAVEILEAQTVLEGLAARHAALKATDDDIRTLRAIIDQMRQGFAEGDLLGMSDLGNQLHPLVLETPKHQTAARMIDALQAQMMRHQYRTILVPGRAPAVIRRASSDCRSGRVARRRRRDAGASVSGRRRSAPG